VAVIENILVTAAVMLLASLFLWPQIHYARQTILHQAALMGIGGYAAAFLVGRSGWAWLPAILLGALVGALVGATIAAATHRVREDKVTILSLGVQMALSNAFIIAVPITGGAAGIFFVPPLFTALWVETTVLIGAAILALPLLWLLPGSAFGRHCRALGDDALLYETWGWNSRRLKSLLGGLSGMGAAMAGALLVGHLSVAEPGLFSIAYSISLVSIVIFLPGRPVVALPLAALTFAVTPELLRFVGLDAARAAYGQQAIFYGLLIVAAFREQKREVPLPGALSGGSWV
jgi:branched-chain amino acid transport system permease protein